MNKNIKLLIIILSFVILIGGAYMLYNNLSAADSNNRLSVQNQQSDEKPDDNKSKVSKAPDFTVYDSEGNMVKLSDFIGKPVVLNFWASWCGPCKMEMPDFHEKYLELGDEIQFLMINVTGGRETLESAKEFVAQEGYTFPVFYDTDSDAATTYGAYSIPTTYFIDSEGNGVAQAVGAIDAETLQRGIDMIK